MLSQRAKYALKAMIALASDRGPQPLSVTDIAKRANVPRAFLEQILSDLKRRNLLISTRGARGGFRLARLPQDISFADIIRHIDGPLALAPCVSPRLGFRKCADCPDLLTCTLRQALLRARDATADVLEGYTLADAAASGEAEGVTPAA